ncbi:ABC transporter permease subunit [Ruegeria sp.]|uniref:ABC transporter permease subunit n=1 Tax=Ruegeria sp. TaxID=1879320 RepID=UPI00231AF058|nr:ABC transporter permease subunit [Ruegeria sp.]MDA7964312.1 ABC transporter permease subunit [Ruegeria sp.]
MQRNLFLKTCFFLGVAFLYIPILVLITFSFNASDKVNVWAGFSLRWYRSLLDDPQILEAAQNSFVIAIVSATLATVLAMIASVVIVRFGPFRGRTLFTGMMSAPLIMPEVITGISLLLLFVAMQQLIGWPANRGFTTVVLAHATFCTAFAAVVLQARLRSLDSSLEEAAADLGSTPLRAFFKVTLPMMGPAMTSAWLLSFTLSLDDLVIASFTTGPNSTTLPMLIFSKVRLGVSPDVNALATLIIVGIGFAVTLSVAAARGPRENQE